MYIYFDTNGTIKEVINDESIRRGSSDYNKIYCYLEGNPDIDDIWYLQKNPDGTLTNEVSFVDNIVTKAIPYDAKRDMKYFQDFEEYQFYVFTLSSSYLSQNGLVVATIRVAENNTLWALGELTFNVQANVINSDNEITQSQYDYLLITISSYYSKTEIDNKLSLKADKSDTYTKTEVDTMGLNLAGQIAGARVELNNRINTTDGILTATQAEVAKLKSVQNVVEVVATKSALNSYDTTKLDANDKVQVIADETHDSASTIYNWNGSAWVYVGAFGGNSYTKAETYNKTQIDSALSDKADKSTINNYIEYDNNIKNIVDDTTYTPTGYVPTNEIYISNVEFKNIYLENLTFNPQSVSITYIYIFERVGNTITIVDTIEHNTSVVGTTSSYTYKIEKYLANGLIGVRCPIATAKSRYGNGNTGFSIINYTSGETSFDFSNPTVINTLNLPFKYIYYNKKPTTDVFPTNVLTVGKNNCNFTDIQDAIDSINDDSSINRYVIKVYQGTYTHFHTWKNKETRANPHYISIIGVDKTSCIINDTLNSTFESNGLLANLTLIANNTIPTSSMYDESEYDSLAGYALHIDGGTNQKTQLIDNCDFISYKGCPAGVGLRGWDKLTFKNCKFYRPTSNTTTGEYNSLYGLLIHNANNGSNTDMEINLYHNEVISEYDTSFSLACSYNWGNTICDAIGNVFYSKNNGFNSVKVTSGIELSGDYIKLSGSSFGNSNSKFNNEIGG